MPRSCCWSAASLLVFLLACGLAGGPAPLAAATILERSIDVEIRPDGSVSERTRLRVRLDEPNDLSSWSPYPVYLDENRELVDLDASATRPDGKVLKVPRRDLDTRQVVGDGELHSSRAYRTVAFPAVPVGSVLALDFEVRERPWFPADEIRLGSPSLTESLRVTVRGGGAGWRWRLDTGSSGALPGPGVTVQETPGGVSVTASHLPGLQPPEQAPGGAGDGAVLRYAWGDTAGWDGVGRWFEGLLAQVARNAEPVRSRARELMAGLTDRRQRMEALADFARRQVRYVAVEVGIGGYRPAPPQQVMERLWGDCKDKALLLVDLLREAGVEAYPALIRLDPEGRVDREFPSNGQFNHMIVAVPAEGLGLGEDAPVSGGYLFLDATQETGGLAWLQPAVQDQEALVVRGGKGVLVRTPILSGLEGRRLAVQLDLAPGGEAAGNASLTLSGEAGAAFLALHKGGKPQEVDRAIRQVFAAYLPAGVQLDGIRWQAIEGGVPDVRLEAQVRVPSLGSPGEAGALPPLPLPSLVEMPAPGLLDGRTVPVVARPFASRVTWRVTLPKDACKAEGPDVKVENALGAFRQTVAVDGRLLTLERGTDLRQRWIDPAAFPALKEIALAESRTNKRRLRLTCGG
jgi:transglutaminase-like putative cysteine protease